jgi:SAM-dependent methyltransferase
VFCRSFYALRDPEQAAAATLRALRPGGLAFVFDFTSPQDLEAMDRFFNDAEPERWPIARVAYQEFNEGVASGRYSLFSEDQMRAIWAEAGAEVIDYDLHEPERLTHRFCILKP